MTWFEDFTLVLLVLISAVCLLVGGLLTWIIIRYRERVHPVPSKVHHNTLLEVAWTIVPVIILVVIAIPSFKLLYYEAAPPAKPDVTIEAIGHQWYWSYVYPDADAGFSFDSLGLSDAAAKKAGEPRLLGVDNVIEVPVGKIIEINTTGADVIHSWALPQMGVKMDAIPGRINKTWFKADRIGTFYGECSELCGARHAFMPFEVKVVPEAEYKVWLAAARKIAAAGGGKYTALNTGAN
jgi:cytochrome c oxidase subunit 2